MTTPAHAQGATNSGDAAAEERVLRAKYLDWCSARVANRIFTLPPDRIYDLAQRAGAGGEFRQLVGRLTEALTLELALPDFETWRGRYAQDPQPYEEELLGFWRDIR